jgi:hypothetical protein
MTSRGWRWLAGVVLVTAACKSEVVPPARPRGVDAKAVWAGGADGGAWILCSKGAASTGRYRCTVWDDPTGEVIARGEFVMAGGRDDGRDLDFNAFDGTNIHLVGGRWLEPVSRPDGAR